MGSAFPSDFIWGIATDAYQIECGGQNDGRGVSIWDAIRKEPGRITDNSDPTTTIGGYENWKEDIQLIKDLGVTHYKMSLNWSRLLPYGDINCINQQGVAYYRKVLEELVANGIQPIVTLYHSDMPLRLYQNDSWLNDKAIEWFTDFCRLCFQKYGDLVKTWITTNELPMRAWNDVCRLEGELFFGVSGVFDENNKNIPLKVAHRILLAHAEVYHMYQREFHAEQKGQIGAGLSGDWCYAKTEADADITRRMQIFLFDWLIQPVFGKHGDYPQEMKDCLGENGSKILPKFTEDEIQKLKGSADFLAINYYRPILIESGIGSSTKEKLMKFKYADDDWEKICGDNDFWLRHMPQGLYDLLHYIKSNYNIPVLITENGCADKMNSDENPLNDEHRIRYIRDHVLFLEKAMQESCNVIGYIAWSLLDNFEWNDGFATKFGFYSVDLESKERKAKKSVQFYREMIKSYQQ